MLDILRQQLWTSLKMVYVYIYILYIYYISIMKIYFRYLDTKILYLGLYM